MLDLLKELCLLPGPPGREDKVREFILSEISGHADCRVDALGNIIAFKKGRKPAKTRLMLDAHMDEVALAVTAVAEDGTLCFATAGGIHPTVLAGRRVRIGDIPGVIGVKPVHVLSEDERGKPPKIEGLRIDIGAADKAEAERLVRIGDMAVFESDFVEFGEGAIKAKALDDRAGCAMLIEMIQTETEYDMTFTFTVQEELGSRGAKTAAFAVRPEAALVAEATTAADIPGTEKHEKVCVLGGGPAVSFMDNGTVYDAELFDLALRTAREISVPCQVKAAVAGGNNAAAVSLAGNGVRTLALSVPCRYLHGGTCVIRKDDYWHTAELMRETADRIAASEPR